MFNRMRLMAVAVALVATAPLAALGTASADTAAPETDQAKKSRTIYLKGKEPKNGVFIATGRVMPDYKGRAGIVERKLKSQKNWSTFKKFKTNNKSKYRERIAPLKKRGVVCYRIKIKGSGNFKTSYSRNIADENGVQVSSKKVCIRTY
jgi:hypothetical protein